MGTGSSPLVGEVDPAEAWRILETDNSARLIDVRTRAEWSFVGIPDIGELAQMPLFIEWARFPDMSRAYAPELRALALEKAAALGEDLPSGIYAGITGPSA